MKRIVLISFLLTCVSAVLSAQALEDAKKLTENEQYDAASSIYNQLISKDPSNGNNYYYFGENLLLGENTDSAKIVFKKGQEMDAANLLLKIGTGKMLLDLMNVSEAKKASDQDPTDASLKARLEDSKAGVLAGTAMIESAVEDAPQKNALVYVEAADAFIQYKNKNLERAKKLLDKALSIDPKNIDANILYGDIYTELNNGSLAAEFYNKALDLDLNSARAIVSKGRLYKRSTNYEGAAQEFTNAIKIDPNYAPAYRELAETELKLGRLGKAKENYKKYLELSNNSCAARVRYATLLFASKDYSGCLNELSQAEKSCPEGYVQLLRFNAYSYCEKEEYAKGMDQIQKLFNKVPEDKRTSYDFEYYGKLLIATDQDSLGIIQLRKAYGLDPNRTELLSDIANAYFKIKKYGASAAAYNEKMGTGKEMSSVDYFNLGRAYFYNAQFKEADTAFAILNDRAPTYARGWLHRAMANIQIDSTSEQGLAKPFYEKYIELAMADSVNISKYSGLVEAYSYLASYYYLIKKDNSNAILYLQKKADMPISPEERKLTQEQIDQIKKEK